ncbi:hypothetical protein HY413_02290 [Candidatus Kaiserbacteria bacterium]|nr:hypothetical protein [Candidatus Kaiserbacteria bacterium]
MPYIQLTYCQKAAGADIAEWIPASEDIGKATIVSADPDNREKVIASRTAYDNSVVGVVASQPGWLLGQEAKGSVQMALAGRVPMRVSLKNGEIRIGDPITTSSIPGVGMKATKAGPIVGKAMEAVNETSSLTSCADPETGSAQQCATALVFVNISWYSPKEDAEGGSAPHATNSYYEPLSVGDDFQTGDVVTLEYRYPQKQGSPEETEKTGYLMPAIPGSFAVGIVSTEIAGPGELLRRVRANNRITQELRLVESGKAEMRISPNSAPIKVGDPLTVSPKDQGMGAKAEAAGFIIGRALEEWGPSSAKKSISVVIDGSWYLPPIDKTLQAHADTGTETHDSLLADFLANIFAKISVWLADAANGIGDFFAKRVHTDELCVKDVCVNRDQLAALLASQSNGSSSNSSSVTNATSSPAAANDNTPPIVTVNGNASSTIDVGSTYVDLGASVTDDHDQNLGIHFFVNGTEVQDIQLDTGSASSPQGSTTTTYSIEYRATDTAGLTGSAMRTVTVVAPTNDNTSTTDASSTPPAVNDNAPPALNDNQPSSTPQTTTTTVATSTAG